MALNPDILTWARSTAGLSVDEAARRLGFRDTRERSAAERLVALEHGEEEPSRSVLLSMAKTYRRSLLVFYLEAPPRRGDRGQDFRTVQGVHPEHYDPLLDALIRDVRRRQAIVKSVLEESEPQHLSFIGSTSMAEPTADLVNRIRNTIQFSLDDFRHSASVELAFRYLREKIEAAGVFVMLVGNLGSHHTNIPVEVFRGFAISDPIAPFVVVNDQDAKAAWSFTVLHEVIHLWLGATGISGGPTTEVGIERYCNDVAGELLLPAAELAQLEYLGNRSFEDVVEAVSKFASLRRISRAMVAYKLLQTHLIHEEQWRNLSDRFRSEWEATRTRQDDESPRAGGPSYYVIRRHRLGGALLNLVRHSLGDGILTYTKAGQVLGVKPRNVDPLLHGNPLLGVR